MSDIDQDTLDTLRLFGEKVSRLCEVSLADEVLKEFRGRVHWVRGEGWSDEYTGPDGEPVEAFVLTLRLLIQNNEPISIRNMSKLYSELPLDPSYSQRFEMQRSQLNDFLDSDTNLSIEDGRMLTHRDVFNIFLYGSLAHTSSNDNKRQIFCDLRSGSWFGLFKVIFADCLRAFVLTLKRMRKINEELLRDLGEAA